MPAVAAEVLDSSPEWTDAHGVERFLGDAVPAATIAELARHGRVPSVKLGSRRIYHLPTIGEELKAAMRDGRAL